EDNEEEENKEGERITIEEDVGEEMPPDIEDEPDEMLGLVAPDKSNKEEQDDKTDENKEVTGEGEQEEIGEGKEGDGQEDENNQGGTNDKEEEEEKDEEQEELKSIKKELQIVQRKILKGQNLKEGGER
uniref:hypothetical protein n=1 Tax=uncultured Parasutterella sp. TaxID=1263098 RepID=UPI00272C8B11